MNIITALIDLFGRCHDINNAFHIFGSYKCNDTACYNAMMNAYCMNQKYNKCLELFDELKDKNYILYTIVFTACANCYKIQIRNDIYNGMPKEIKLNELSILSSLNNMFGKFGNVSKCKEIFDLVKTINNINNKQSIGVN